MSSAQLLWWYVSARLIQRSYVVEEIRKHKYEPDVSSIDSTPFLALNSFALTTRPTGHNISLREMERLPGLQGPYLGA